MAGVIPQVGQVAQVDQVHQVAVTARVAVIPQAAPTVVIHRVARTAVAHRVARRAVIPPATQALPLHRQRADERSLVVLFIQTQFDHLSMFVILALAGGTAIGGKAKKPWIGNAIIGADCSVSFGIN
jgi:hypothetical protein